MRFFNASAAHSLFVIASASRCDNPFSTPQSLRGSNATVAIRSPFRVLRILSRSAFRMTSHFVIETPVNGRRQSVPLSLRAPQGARQSVFPLRVLRILSLFALRMTSRLVIETPVNGRRFYILRRPQGFWLLPFTPSGHRFFVFFIFFAFGFTVFVF